MEEELQEQGKNRNIDAIKPWQFKKGQSGNPKGRPPGKSLKERAKAMLNAMTEEEEQEFFNGLDKRVVWEMAEGKPDAKEEIEHKGNLVIQVDNDIATKNEINISPEANSQEQQTI